MTLVIIIGTFLAISAILLTISFTIFAVIDKVFKASQGPSGSVLNVEVESIP